MEAVASVLLIFGASMTLLGAVGLLRFRDVFTRMHAATKPATFGIIIILTATALVLPSPDPVAKLVLVILLQFITAPVGAHLIGRSAFRAGGELTPGTRMDEASQRLREGRE